MIPACVTLGKKKKKVAQHSLLSQGIEEKIKHHGPCGRPAGFTCARTQETDLSDCKAEVYTEHQQGIVLKKIKLKKKKAVKDIK